jgi:hypothetical protein
VEADFANEAPGEFLLLISFSLAILAKYHMEENKKQK